jgi:hypothetical protein
MSAPDINQRMAAMDGELGDEVQFESLIERGRELIKQAFDLVQLMSGDDVTITPGDTQLIHTSNQR